MARGPGALLVFLLCLAESKQEKYKAFHPGEIWLDSDGNRIRAHQPHIFWWGPKETYCWYGTSKVGSSDGTKGAINLYTSTDLYNWDFHGAVINGSGYAARPSMLGKNPTTGKFVLWMKGGKSFRSATADSPLGPFTDAGTYAPTSSSHSGDSASFHDPVTGNAFMVYSQHLPSRAMKVLKLSDDWTALSDGAPVATVEGRIEAPAPFYSFSSKKHYIWCSHTSGWRPNPAELLSADDGMMSAWKSLGNPSHSDTTFGTQGSHTLPMGVHNGVQRLIYMGDRYEPYITSVEGSRYIFLPMEVASDGTVTIHNVSAWSVEEWPTASSNVESEFVV